VRELVNHLFKLLLLGLFPCPDGWVGTEVEVFLNKGVEINRSFRGEILVGNSVNAFCFGVAGWAANSSHELNVADNTVVVSVKILENTLELTWGEGNSVLFDTPLELLAVKCLIAVSVIFSKHLLQSVNATISQQNVSDFLQNLVWLFAVQSKDWADVGVIAATSKSDPASELFKIDLSVAVCVKPIEQCNHLLFRENATNCF